MATPAHRRKDRITPSQARAARRRRRHRRRRALRLGIFVVVGAVALLFIVGLFAPGLPLSIGSSSSPAVGDHWHASYEVSVCGEVLPPFPNSPGGVHSHGDGLIHIHPRSSDETGSNATLALFFSSVDGALTDDSLTLPSGKTYANGDPCPDDEPGQLIVTVDGVIQDAPSFYVPHDDDEISITF